MNEFDVVVLGGGSGSQVATAAATEGFETAVLEPGPLGGACITRGCVPSKALIQRAEVLEEIRHADRFGIEADVRDVDFSAITDAVHDTVYEKADGQREALEENEHVTLFETAGRFVDDRTISLESGSGGGSEDSNDDGDQPERIRGEHVVIAVGSRPTAPPIDGLEEVDYRTSDDALYLDERPDDLVIVGGGYIATELGYFFASLGTDVSIVGRSETLLAREDEDVSTAVTNSLEKRCEVYTGHEVAAVSSRNEGVSVVAESGSGAERELGADELLVAAGRRPNTDTLALENTGVETDDREHVVVDEHLETTVENVWALGDVLEEFPFKHAADYETRVVTQNVLGALGERGREESGDQREGEPTANDRETRERATVDYTGMPHAIFTTPQVASVGQTEAQLEDGDLEFESTLVTYDAAPLGTILDLEEAAFVKVLATPAGELLGCHVVGPQASTLIHEVVVAMQAGSGTVDDVADAVHVHPALNEVVLKAFDDLSAKPYSTAPDWR